MIGEPESDWGLVVRYEGRGLSLIISPGEGTLGSLSCKFMRTVERRLPVWEGCRFLVDELPEEPRGVQSSVSRVDERSYV